MRKREEVRDGAEILMVFGSGGRERPSVLQPGLSAGRASSHNILHHLVLDRLLPADTGAFLFGIG